MRKSVCALAFVLWLVAAGAAHGQITAFTEPDCGNKVLRLTHNRAVRAYANYHNIQCWNYNGRYTVYTLCGGTALSQEGNYEVHIIDLVTGDDLHVGMGLSPRWATGRNWLFYSHYDGSDWTTRRYDVDTGRNIQIASGTRFLGSVDATDTWLFGDYRRHFKGVEWTHARTRTELVDPPKLNVWEILPAPSRHPWAIANPRHPVAKSRYRMGDPVWGTKSLLFDIDGTRTRIGAILAEEGHHGWRGDGEFLLSGNKQVSGRRWNEPFPSDLVMLAAGDMGDVCPMDTTGRYICGGELNVADCRSGAVRVVARPRSDMIFPADGDYSTLSDIDPKGSPDGTKVHYHSTRDLASARVARIVAYDGDAGVLAVNTTTGWPDSGDLVYRAKEVIGYSKKTATTFEGIERAKYYSLPQSPLSPGSELIDLDNYVLRPNEHEQSFANLMIRDLVAANGDPDPDNNPLIYPVQTDCYIVVTRQPDSSHLRLDDDRIEIIPGQRHAEIRHYRLLRNGAPYPDGNTVYAPSASLTVNDTGAFTAVAVEWSGLESPPSNALVVANAPADGDVHRNIPDDFSWTYEQTVGDTTYTKHRHDEGVFDRTISQAFRNGGRWVREDLDHDGRVVRHTEYDAPDGTLLKRIYYRHDGPPERETWVYSEEKFDATDGYKTEYVRYRVPVGPDSGSEYEHWWYSDGRPIIRYKRGRLMFDYRYRVETAVVPEDAGSVVRAPDQAGFALGQTVELAPKPVAGHAFTHWSGDAAGSDNPLGLTMPNEPGAGTYRITANFAELAGDQWTLRVDHTHSRGGSVAIDSVKAIYERSDGVTITATAHPGWDFRHWDGDAKGTNNPLAFSPGAGGAYSITANFTPHYALTAQASPPGAGTVVIESVQEYYSRSDAVTVTATSAFGYRFSHWSTDAGGHDNPLTFAPTQSGSGWAYEQTFNTNVDWAILNGTWAVVDGRYKQTDTNWGRQKVITDYAFTNGQIQFDAIPDRYAKGAEQHGSGFGVYVKYIDADNYICLRIGMYGGISLTFAENGVEGDASVGAFAAIPGAEHHVKLTLDNDQLTLIIDDTDYGTHTVPLAGVPGNIGFYTENPTTYDNLTVTTDFPVHIVTANFVEIAASTVEEPDGADR